MRNLITEEYSIENNRLYKVFYRGYVKVLIDKVLVGTYKNDIELIKLINADNAVQSRLTRTKRARVSLKRIR